MIPYEASFVIGFTYLKTYEVINVLLDLLFLFDNCLIFFTSRRIEGGETFDHYLIFTAYVQTWRFWFDTISLLGITIFKLIHPFFKTFQLFKAVRVYRMAELIRNSWQPIEVKVVMKICCYVLYIALYIHWLACIFNYLVLFNAPDAYFIQRNGTYQNVNSQELVDSKFNPYYYDGRDFIITIPHTYAEQAWK